MKSRRLSREGFRLFASKGFKMCTALAIAPSIFADMTTYYCQTLEEALKRAKKAGRRPGCFFGGIILKSGKKGFAIYRDGKVVEQYSVLSGR